MSTRSSSKSASAADRKVVLMRLLAEAEVQRLGIAPSREEVLALALWWQREFAIEDPARFEAWLEFAGLDMERFSAMMWRFSALTKLVQRYREEIEAQLPDHLAMHSIHEFVGRPT
jgi:hypothetical protein